MTSFATELATPSVTEERTDTLPRLIYKEDSIRDVLVVVFVVWLQSDVAVSRTINEKPSPNICRESIIAIPTAIETSRREATGPAGPGLNLTIIERQTPPRIA